MTIWIPPGYAEATRASWLMDDEISRAVIRLWCEVLEDANPMYYDDNFAAGTPAGAIIAPPAMIMIWCTRAEWTPSGRVPTIAEYFRDNVPGYPHSIGLSSRHRHSRPLRLGERLTVHQFVNPPTEEETTVRGRGRRVIRYNSLRDQAGNEIASLEIESLRIRRPEDAAYHDDALPAMPAWSQRPEIAWAPEAGPVAEAEAGAVLYPLITVVTYKRFIKWVAATRDFFEAHHDRDYATKLGAPDMYIGVHFFHGLVGRFITDWTGPTGLLRTMDFRSYGRCFPNETVTVVGRVAPAPAVGGPAGSPEPEDRALIDIEIAIGCERGKLYDAAAAVSIPAQQTAAGSPGQEHG
jgi:N-terminal half of MaoC dehydratase